MYERGSLDPEIAGHYRKYDEGGRLFRGLGRLELVRVRELILRWLPSPPAVILDVGGGEGVHALWLAREGYQVHLIDAHSPHVEAARRASSAQPDFPIASCETGDARRLEEPDGSVDAVLLFGPLYHLTESSDRLKALREARRVLVDGGRLFAIAVSRFASTFDGFRHGYFEDPRFEEIAARDRRDGQHRNPTQDSRFFTNRVLPQAPGLCVGDRAGGAQTDWAFRRAGRGEGSIGISTTIGKTTTGASICWRS